MKQIESLIFNNADLLEKALKHKSFTAKSAEADDNERMEFLGDAVIQLAISQMLFEEQPLLAEGDMTRFRSALVNQRTLARAAESLDFGDYIQVGAAERERGFHRTDRLLSCMFEAVVGALYLDQGFTAASKWVCEQLIKYRPEGLDALHDYKTRLQEHVQAQGKLPPVYRILDEVGPKHQPIFRAEAVVDETIVGEGSGSSKKEAEQAAAKQALESILEKERPL